MAAGAPPFSRPARSPAAEAHAGSAQGAHQHAGSTQGTHQHAGSTQRTHRVARGGSVLKDKKVCSTTAGVARKVAAPPVGVRAVSGYATNISSVTWGPVALFSVVKRGLVIYLLY